MIAVVAVGALCASAYFGRFLVFPPNNKYSIKYADQMQVQGGYHRIDEDGADGSCGCNLVRHYIGPAGADPAQVFLGPGLRLVPNPPAPGSYDMLYEPLVWGDGYTDETDSCDVSVDQLRRQAGLLGDDWRLSQREITGWNDGSLDVYRLYVMCEPDAKHIAPDGPFDW
jgi:hypothetical protein